MAAGGRRRRRTRWRATGCERAVDAAAVAAGWGFALIGAGLTAVPSREHPKSLLLALVAAAATFALFERRGVYSDRPRLPRIEETARTLTSVVGGATVVALFTAITDIHLGAKELFLAVPVVTLLVFLARGYLRAWRSRPGGAGQHVERVVVIGAGQEARELAELIDEHPDSNMVLLGIVGDRDVAERHGLTDLWLGPPSRARQLLEEHGADSAVVNATGFRGPQFREITGELLSAGFDVRISTGVTRLYCGRFDVNSLVHEPLISVVPQHEPAWQLRLKRVADVLGAGVALVLAAPVMLLTALAIKLEDGGPVLFQQKRTGMGGTPFLMTKFRSMYPDAEARRAELVGQNERTGPLFKLSSDPRVTKVGRFIRETSIDELPQLFNVLRGDMSLVGPRPPLPEEQADFDNELQGRFRVRPGITGLWQVEARSNASFNAYRRLDLHYVENWSLWMDLRILLATAEQLVVSVATLPLRRLLGSVSDDQVAPRGAAGGEPQPPPPEPVVDLRDRGHRAAGVPAHSALGSIGRLD